MRPAGQSLPRSLACSTPEPRSTPPGRPACATSTPRHTTGSASPKAVLVPPSRDNRAGRTWSHRRWGGCSSRSRSSRGWHDQGFVVPATHRRVWDFSRDGIRRSLEASLQRLGVDRLDVAYLHDPDMHWAQVLDEGYPALAELRAEGMVDAIGAGMNQAEMLAALVRHCDVDVLMLAGRYTLLEQDSLDDLLPLCESRGVGIVAAGVFNSGLLALIPSGSGARAGPAPRRGAAGADRASPCDRRSLRTARHDTPRRGDRVPAGTPRRSERLRRSAVGGADGQKRDAASRGDHGGAVGRAEDRWAPP